MYQTSQVVSQLDILPLKLNSSFVKRFHFIWKVYGRMALRYPCPRVQLGMSNSQRNLDEAKANIQMQKTGATGIGYAKTSTRF
jgi:hypothetical protein